MDNLDKELQRLSKINPEEGFIEMSKTRLMHRIAKEQPEAWFRTFLTSTRFSDPSKSFITQARLRLMAQINQLPQPVKMPLKGLAYFLNFLKKAVASTLVMMIAVTAVLFQLEGNTVVEASNDSYLEVISGQVSLKEGGVETWENVPAQKEIEAGDIVQLQEGAQAVIHFFDGTEVRLDGDTTLSLNQLDFSPAVKNQAVIEIVLEKGKIWTQTVNADDGYAGFTLLTKEGVISALNASFMVSKSDLQAAEVAVFNGALNVSAFSPITGELIQKIRLTPDKLVTLTLDDQNQTVFAPNTITPELKGSEWVKANLEKDKIHLAELSKISLERLTLMAGTLPGDMLYSIKQAKENLRLAWSEDADSVKIDIANNRLNEAIVLFERGEIETAQKSLEAYQQLTREILASNKTQDSKTLITQLVAPHQKVLFTKPADKNTLVVKETLQQTAEILAQNTLDLENIKLKNSVASLQDIRTLIDQGQMELAKEKLSKYKVNQVSIAMIEGVKNPEERREAFQQILDLKQEEKDLLALVSEEKEVLQEDEELMAMVESTARQVEADADKVQSLALTVLPDLAITATEPTEEVIDSSPTLEVKPPVLSEAEQLAARINIYTSADGQMNQIHRLLGDMLEDTSKIDFLIEVSQYLSGRAKNYLGTRILQLQNKLKEEETLETVEPTQSTGTTPEVTDPISTPTTEVPTTDPTATQEDSDEPLGQIRTLAN